MTQDEHKEALELLTTVLSTQQRMLSSVSPGATSGVDVAQFCVSFMMEYERLVEDMRQSGASSH